VAARMDQSSPLLRRLDRWLVHYNASYLHSALGYPAVFDLLLVRRDALHDLALHRELYGRPTQARPAAIRKSDAQLFLSHFLLEHAAAVRVPDIHDRASSSSGVRSAIPGFSSASSRRRSARWRSRLRRCHWRLRSRCSVVTAQAVHGSLPQRCPFDHRLTFTVPRVSPH
jgi:hypothetical protein